jgi:hypothetical protein
VTAGSGMALTGIAGVAAKSAESATARHLLVSLMADLPDILRSSRKAAMRLSDATRVAPALFRNPRLALR